jgi:hypothetical protein
MDIDSESDFGALVNSGRHAIVTEGKTSAENGSSNRPMRPALPTAAPSNARRRPTTFWTSSTMARITVAFAARSRPKASKNVA